MWEVGSVKRAKERVQSGQGKWKRLVWPGQAQLGGEVGEEVR